MYNAPDFWSDAVYSGSVAPPSVSMKNRFGKPNAPNVLPLPALPLTIIFNRRGLTSSGFIPLDKVITIPLIEIY
jgi:hypothetical protein